MQQIHNSILNNQNISSPLLVSSYTSNASRSMLVRCTVNGISGGDDYTIYATLKEGGIEPENIMQPVNSYYINTGVNDITFPSIMIPVNSGDILRLYIQGLNNDTNIKIVTSWFDLAIVSPTEVQNIVDTSASKIWNYEDRTITQLIPEGISASTIWNYSERTLTEDFPEGISASTIWSFANRTLTDQFPQSISASTIWEYNDRTLTEAFPNGISASTIWLYENRELTSQFPNPVSASEVWNYDNRMLTSASNLGLASELSVSNIETTSASEIWNYEQRELTSISTSTSASEIWDYENRTITSACGLGLASASSIADISFTLSEIQSAVNDIDVSEILSLIIEGTYTFKDILQIISAVLFGKLSGGDTTSLAFRSILDDKNRIVATVNQDTGDRLSIVVTKD